MPISRSKAGRTGAVWGAAAAAAALAISTASPGWTTSTALVIGGIGTPTMHDVVVNQLLGGALQDYDERRVVNWPAEARPYTGADDMTLGDSIRAGTVNLDAEIDAALDRLERDENGDLLEGERVTVVGLSAGSLVVTEVLRDWQFDGEDNPDADEINFVVVADSSRQQIIDDTDRYNPTYDYTYRLPPVTPYDTVEVTGEYDGLADFPDRWWNLTAVANALAGAAIRHIPTMFSDLSTVPEENITVTRNLFGGTTTRYLVPAERLPLVVLNPSLAPREAELKATVDRGYSRNDPVPTLVRTLTNDVEDEVDETVTPEDAQDDPEDLERAVRSVAGDDEAGAGLAVSEMVGTLDAAEDTAEDATETLSTESRVTADETDADTGHADTDETGEGAITEDAAEEDPAEAEATVDEDSTEGAAGQDSTRTTDAEDSSEASEDGDGATDDATADDESGEGAGEDSGPSDS
ncbi:PE-PPE domain-containing protein [Mycobacterium sp. NAZ190054]|uniref:PE-PPE domain-containing protein n=1 Tax=Mycobacterium sp. NAZ190054 TaxID=1747766 RepID=UPI000791AB30|nr:PE-PPE domain-containing protein [Mycobacterium sp. NAZ190054]KWX66254.1 PE-PPE domain-containing protein [Mycobacterium sp. NAZ190054]